MKVVLHSKDINWMGHADIWPSKNTDWPINRSAILNRYQRWSFILARSLYKKFNVNGADIQDYEQFAFLGLAEAVDAYDPGRGIKFRHYAFFRVRGAVLNGVFKFSEASDFYRYRSSLIRDRTRSISNLEEQTEKKEQLVGYILSLTVGFLLEETAENDVSELNSGPGVSNEELFTLTHQMWKLVRQLQGNLSRVIELHYGRGLNFVEVSEILKLSTGRISQLHAQALRELKLMVSWSG